MAEKEYILAMYDVRGKQEYIYNYPRIKQIAGASWIIRDCFRDYLFPAAKEVSQKGIFFYQDCSEEENAFSEGGFRKHLDEGYAGEVVYCGGGNFFVLYENHKCYIEINKRFFAKVLKGTGSLRVLSSYIEGVDFGDYRGDIKKLYAKHRKAEQKEGSACPVNTLPIVQTDYITSQPLTQKWSLPGDQGTEMVKVSTESAAKYAKYEECYKRQGKEVRSITELDKLIEKKGTDSHLAVIYIDGNSMGAKVEKKTESCRNYKDSIRALREFSDRIEEQYIELPQKAIQGQLPMGHRFVVSAGDEVTFICKAKDACRIAKLYFEELKKSDPENSSCAGIAIFHSHAPFSEAYRIAEECCETGKRLMKETGVVNACLMDFHYCQGAIGTSLEEIRAHEGTEEFCVPWLMTETGDNERLKVPDWKCIEDTAEVLRKIARSNSKMLLAAAKESDAAYQIEIERICAHCADGQVKELLKDRKELLLANRRLVYRMMVVYDHWFREEKQNAEEED